MDSDAPRQNANEILDYLVVAYYHAWFRFHPRLAMDAGMQDYAHLLPSLDEDRWGALLALNEKLINSLDELAVDELNKRRRLNYELLRSSAYRENQSLLKNGLNRLDPQYFLPFWALKQLEIYPVEEFKTVLLQLLAAIPEHLRGARMLLQRDEVSIPRLWLEACLQVLQQGMAYLHELPHRPVVVQNMVQSTELMALLGRAQQAVRDYECFLKHTLLPVAKTEVAVGRQTYQQMLLSQHRLPLELDVLSQTLQRQQECVVAELQKLSMQMFADDDFVAVAERLRVEAERVDDPVACYQQHLLTARAFVRDNGMLDMSGESMPKVSLLPKVLCFDEPYGSYLSLASWGGNRTGICWLAGDEGDAALAHTAVQAGWPGHHLQEMLAKQNSEARSVVRRTNRSALFAMGWELYAEQLMVEKGFFKGVEHRFWLLLHRLWAVKQAQLDFAVHCEGLSLDEAAEQLRQVGLSERQVQAKLLCFTRSPTRLLADILGWLLIKGMRDYYMQQEQTFADLSSFHRRLHEVGPVPLPLVASYVFGDSFWHAVFERTFE
ncbi:MAG: DUF885 family protein [Gammaproteobacteria bacterium]|nr:DUF885 family protein [Gammaproteobacteria bacterium]